jgi:hypothetical protein
MLQHKSGRTTTNWTAHKLYQEIINYHLKSVLTVSDLVERSTQFINLYLNVNPPIPNRNVLISNGVCHDTNNGWVAFRLKSLQKWIQSKGDKEITRSDITQAIYRIGGKHHFYNLKGHGINAYCIPQEYLSILTPLTHQTQ